MVGKIIQQLDNLSGYNEITDELIRECRENDLVIVCGASDDLTLLLGAIDEEYGMSTLIIRPKGSELKLAVDDIEDYGSFDGVYKKFTRHDAIQLENHTTKIGGYIRPIFGDDGFVFETDIKHEKFKFFEDGELICTGIVFNVNDIKN